MEEKTYTLTKTDLIAELAFAYSKGKADALEGLVRGAKLESMPTFEDLELLYRIFKKVPRIIREEHTCLFDQKANLDDAQELTAKETVLATLSLALQETLKKGIKE